MHPVICKIPSEMAAPFTIDYCTKFGVPYYGDVNYGHGIAWYGAAYRGKIRAVIGFKLLNDGLYVFGFYFDNTAEGKRAFIALDRWTYDLRLPLWAHIREDNPKMWNRLLKEGWQITGSTKNKELLMHWPLGRSLNLVQCQELVNN